MGFTFSQTRRMVQVTANYTALSGDVVLAYQPTPGAFTVTLPTPTINFEVTVIAWGAVSGTSPITISTGSTPVIAGVGLQATSMLLGVPGASVRLRADGTNWYILSGQQDTGWLSLGLGTNIGANPSPPQVRLLGDTVHLSGGFFFSGTSYAPGYVFLTLPSSTLAPLASRFVVSSTGTGSGNNYTVPLGFTPGSLNITNGGGSLTGSVAAGLLLDGISYRLI